MRTVSSESDDVGVVVADAGGLEVDDAGGWVVGVDEVVDGADTDETVTVVLKFFCKSWASARLTAES